MANFADYVKNEGLDEEIGEAVHQQAARDTATPQDWEVRYKELEQHNSRQAQELGTLRNENGKYKNAFDEYLLNDAPPVAIERVPVTSDDLFSRPDEVLNEAIDNHPAIKEAKERAEYARKQAILSAKQEFEGAHPNYQATITDPAFAEWVRKNRTRIELAQRADQWDFGAADALFSLYESEQRLNGITTKVRTEKALENAALESSGIGEAPGPAKFSRHDMRELMIAARKGDAKAERKLQVNLPKYRAALAAGEVTD